MIISFINYKEVKLSSLKHPAGLKTLFFTEMWERMSYYGMRGILVLFMTASIADGGLDFSNISASAIYGIYAAAKKLSLKQNFIIVFYPLNISPLERCLKSI